MPERPVYARIQDLRNEGLSPSLYPDARALTLLERAADMIESLCDQRFGPKREHFFRDGRNGRIVVHPKANKILEIEEFALVLPDHTRFVLSPQTYVVYDRDVRLRRGETGLPSERAVKEGGEAWTLNNYSKTRREITLPDELHNADVTGTFGWLDPTRVRSTDDPNMNGETVAISKEITTLAANLNIGDTIIQVGNTGTFALDDVLHIDPTGDQTGGNFWVIVGGVYHWIDFTMEPLVNGGTQVKIGNVAQATIGDNVTLFDGVTTVTVTVTGFDLLNSRILFAPVVLAATLNTGARATTPPLPFFVSEWTTTTLEPLIPGGTQIQLDDISLATVGDTVTIGDGNTSTTIVITAIDVPSQTIFFTPAVFVNYNALSPGNISAGAEVDGVRTSVTPGVVTIDPCPGQAFIAAEIVRWGRIPRRLKEAVVRTVFANRNGWCDTNVGGQYLRKSEKTDNYQYENFQPFTTMANIYAGTGDPRADVILSQFRAPPYAQYV